jgi:signal recognition particle receptor subunit beta
VVFFNYATKEITAKVVYYGPGLSGKTTNLQYIYNSLPQGSKGKMISLATADDRTLFFDFLPIEIGTIKGMHVRVQLYTVPGQVFYNTTRKLVLQGVDGLVFVADSQKEMLDANFESWDNLDKNLAEQGRKLKDIPHVIQYNKRDLPNIMPSSDLNTMLNKYNVPYFEAIAIRGGGVYESLREAARLVLTRISREHGGEEVDTSMIQESSEVLAISPPEEIATNPPLNLEKRKGKLSEIMPQPSATISQVPASGGDFYEIQAGDLHLEEEMVTESDFSPGTDEQSFARASEEKTPGRTLSYPEDEANIEIEEKEVSLPISITVGKNAKRVRLRLKLEIKINRK